MNYMILAVVTIAASAVSNDVVPPGADAINGSFARMLERVDQEPAALVVRGEPDQVDRLVAEALRPMAACVLRQAAL